MEEDGELRAVLLDLAGPYPTYGSRRLTVLLKRAGWTSNHKRIQRIRAEMGRTALGQTASKCTTNSQHHGPRYPNLVADLQIVCPDQVWVADITSVRFTHDFV